MTQMEYVLCCAKPLQLYLTPCNTMRCSPPGSSAHGILQARILEWVAISFSRRSSEPRDRTHISWHLLHWPMGSLPLPPPGKPQMEYTFPEYVFEYIWNIPLINFHLCFLGYKKGLSSLPSKGLSVAIDCFSLICKVPVSASKTLSYENSRSPHCTHNANTKGWLREIFNFSQYSPSFSLPLPPNQFKYRI